jgi:hypothetical protein
MRTARVFSRDSPVKVAQWTGSPIRESWGVLWLVIRLLSVRADVSSSVGSIPLCTERLYCIPLYTCQHAGALPSTTNTSPTPRRRTVRTKYYYCTVVEHTEVPSVQDEFRSEVTFLVPATTPGRLFPWDGISGFLYTKHKTVCLICVWHAASYHDGRI